MNNLLYIQFFINKYILGSSYVPDVIMEIVMNKTTLFPILHETHNLLRILGWLNSCRKCSGRILKANAPRSVKAFLTMSHTMQPEGMQETVSLLPCEGISLIHELYCLLHSFQVASDMLS